MADMVIMITPISVMMTIPITIMGMDITDTPIITGMSWENTIESLANITRTMSLANIITSKIKEGKHIMNNLKKFALIVGVLATLSGCAYGTYDTYGGSSPSPGEPNYLANCGPLNDQQQCNTWFYGH